MGEDNRKRIDGVANEQLGLITRAQAMEVGVSSNAIDRRLLSGELERVYPSVYRLRAGVPDSYQQRLLALCLSHGEDAFASHRSAAWLYGLDGFRQTPKLEITVPHGRRKELKHVTVHQRRAAHDEGYCRKQGVPVTTLNRTLLDLESTMSESGLEIALDSAARGHPELFMELTEFLAPIATRGRPNGGTLDALVALRLGGAPTGSMFETRVLQVLREAGVEEPTLQYPVFKELDRPFAHIDFAWVKRKIALFADGASYHLARRRARMDATQRLELMKLGWKVAVVFPKMLDDGAWISCFCPLFWPRFSRFPPMPEGR